MNIEEKYLRLLHKLIYDKRKNTHGILSSCCINRSYCKNGYYWYYLGYMDRIHTKKDTVYNEENIEFLVKGSVRLVDIIDN